MILNQIIHYKLVVIKLLFTLLDVQSSPLTLSLDPKIIR